eukprot:TRINITY_DN2288_c1_g1_i3.p1 TRINITY_DN2288_c1_g1~~TRINITY_DN2288_c1_g1_i3.p1  ORF type:complete len:118 (+),score=13.48 TRINITY_DN2288_c1_g1_i3:38-391(+)
MWVTVHVQPLAQHCAPPVLAVAINSSMLHSPRKALMLRGDAFRYECSVICSHMCNNLVNHFNLFRNMATICNFIKCQWFHRLFAAVNQKTWRGVFSVLNFKSITTSPSLVVLKGTLL